MPDQDALKNKEYNTLPSISPYIKFPTSALQFSSNQFPQSIDLSNGAAHIPPPRPRSPRSRRQARLPRLRSIRTSHLKHSTSSLYNRQRSAPLDTPPPQRPTRPHPRRRQPRLQRRAPRRPQPLPNVGEVPGRRNDASKPIWRDPAAIQRPAGTPRPEPPRRWDNPVHNP